MKRALEYLGAGTAVYLVISACQLGESALSDAGLFDGGLPFGRDASTEGHHPPQGREGGTAASLSEGGPQETTKAHDGAASDGATPDSGRLVGLIDAGLKGLLDSGRGVRDSGISLMNPVRDASAQQCGECSVPEQILVRTISAEHDPNQRRRGSFVSPELPVGAEALMRSSTRLVRGPLILQNVRIPYRFVGTLTNDQTKAGIASWWHFYVVPVEDACPEFGMETRPRWTPAPITPGTLNQQATGFIGTVSTDFESSTPREMVQLDGPIYIKPNEVLCAVGVGFGTWNGFVPYDT